MHTVSNAMSVDRKSLSPAKRWLLDQIHKIYFGRICNLVIRNGEPVRVPPPKLNFAYKFGGQQSARKQVTQDFLLKEHQAELIELLDIKQNGTIATLTIRDGLPCQVDWQDD